MKVLQVIDTLKIGGAEQITVLISNLLKSNGIDISVLVLVEEGDLINNLDKNIPVVFLDRKKRLDLKKLKHTAKLLDEFDIIHVHLKHNFRYIVLASKYLSQQRHRLVFHDHSHYYGISKFSFRSLKDSLFKSVFKPEYFIGVSDVNCNWAKSELKLSDQNIFLLENTISKEIVDSKNIAKSGIVMASNISRVKNIEFGIKLAHKLNENLTIYGQVRDEIYFKELKELILNLKYIDNIKFEHQCNNIQSELQKYKYAIHTSHKETGPLVLIEFLAQNLPFIAFATGQVYDTLKDVLPQCFVSNFNIDSWIEKIENMEPNTFHLFEETYNTYFSSDNYIKKCLKIYQRIINS